MMKFIRAWLRKSAHFHIRENRVESLREVVDLIDRFHDDRLAYELEWDDFISWKNDNPNIEAVRERIALTEPLFFSKNQTERDKAIALLIEERNRAAALCGVGQRSHYPA